MIYFKNSENDYLKNHLLIKAKEFNIPVKINSNDNFIIEKARITSFDLKMKKISLLIQNKILNESSKILSVYTITNGLVEKEKNINHFEMNSFTNFFFWNNKIYLQFENLEKTSIKEYDLETMH